jgi:hypothetical protein
MMDREGAALLITGTIVVYLMTSSLAAQKFGLVAFLYGAAIIGGILLIHKLVSMGLRNL